MPFKYTVDVNENTPILVKASEVEYWKSRAETSERILKQIEDILDPDFDSLNESVFERTPLENVMKV